MDSRKYSQIVRERVIRHNRLMKLIKNYSLTQQQTKKLDRIKLNTMMEINIRYLRSDHNRYYKFPKLDTQSQSDEEEKFDPLINKKQNIVYDLRVQNQVFPTKSVSHKILSLDNTSRKVLSLEIERNSYQREKMLRLNLKNTKQLSSKNLTRKNSISQKIKKQTSRFKLPQLKLERPREYLKTEAKTNEEDNQIHSVIGKKLATQSSQSPSKMRGVERYLKKIETKQKQTDSKAHFKKIMLLPSKFE